MTLVIGQEGIKHTPCILALCRLGVHIVFLIACRDKAQLQQGTRHRREAQHCQIILLGTHILTPCSLTNVFLHIFRQLDAIVDILILYDIENDITFRRIRIIALIGLFVIFLQEDNSIFALGHLQILKHTRFLTCTLTGAKCIRLETMGHPTLRERIDMNRNKKISFCLVRDFCTAIQLYKHIFLSCIEDFYIRTIALYHLSECQGELQCQILLLRNRTNGTSIVPAMTSIYHQRKLLTGSECCH